MFKLQAIDSGCIGIFDIEIIEVVIDLIHDTYPERLGISIYAEINAVYKQVTHHGHISIGLQDGIDLFKSFVNMVHIVLRIEHSDPERVNIFGVIQRYSIVKPGQIVIRKRHFKFPQI
jgi:hypothetical protein